MMINKQVIIVYYYVRIWLFLTSDIISGLKKKNVFLLFNQKAKQGKTEMSCSADPSLNTSPLWLFFLTRTSVCGCDISDRAWTQPAVFSAGSLKSSLSWPEDRRTGGPESCFICSRLELRFSRGRSDFVSAACDASARILLTVWAADPPPWVPAVSTDTRTDDEAAQSFINSVLISNSVEF